MKKYEVLSPTCYQKFACKGGDCRTDCCSDWSIILTKEEYRKTKRKRGDLDGLICPQKRQTGIKSYKMVLNESGHCPFFTKEKLCGLQLQFGPEILSHTCKVFPRKYHNYLNRLEGGMSLGCEKVLELLLEENGKLQFNKYHKTFPDEEGWGFFADEKRRLQYPILKYYCEIQDLCVSLLQAEDASLEDRILLMGMALKRIDELVQENRAEEIPDYIEHFFTQLETLDFAEQLNALSVENIGVLYNNLLLAKKLASNNKIRYKKLVQQITDKLQTTFESHLSEASPTQQVKFSCSVEIYNKGKEHLQQFLQKKEYFWENMMVAFLFFFQTPFYNVENGVWKDYTYFVWLYSMIKFALTVVLEEDSTDEDMIDCCVTIFRTFGHDKNLYEKIVKQFEENETNTLAYMAIFLKA